ncbi:MAG: OB-fold nucleic acid binding domain-containing protein [Nitrospirota bacterium]
MKTAVMMVLVLGLFLSGCSAEKYGLGVDSSAPTVMVKDIILKPELQGQQVNIEGKIVSQCQSNGCWFFLQDESGQVFINLAPNNFALPSRMGKRVKVTGIVARGREGGYQIIARGVEVR